MYNQISLNILNTGKRMTNCAKCLKRRQQLKDLVTKSIAQVTETTKTIVNSVSSTPTDNK